MIIGKITISISKESSEELQKFREQCETLKKATDGYTEELKSLSSYTVTAIHALEDLNAKFSALPWYVRLIFWLKNALPTQKGNNK